MKTIKSSGKDLGILLLYMAMVCLITLGLLWLIYLFKPKEAYVYLTYKDYNNLDYEVEYAEAKSFSVESTVYSSQFTGSSFAFNDETEIDFSDFNVIYNGVVYQGDEYSLRFIPESSFKIDEIEINDYSDFYDRENIWFYFESSSDKTYKFRLEFNSEENPNKFYSKKQKDVNHKVNYICSNDYTRMYIYDLSWII